MLPGLTGMVGFSGNAAAAPTDPHFANTVLLLSGDGTNGSTTFTDESFAARGNATAQGDAQVDTSLKKFGTGAIRLDGSVDNLIYADSADWNLSGDFTLDMWVAVSGLSGGVGSENVFISHWRADTNLRSWLLRYRGDLGTDTLQFLGSSNGVASDLDVSGNWTPTANQFYLLSVDRSGNVFRTYVDGVMLAKVTQTITLFDSSTSLRIGSRFQTGETAFTRGSLDEIRLTKGVARYASDSGFTVPTAAYPRS